MDLILQDLDPREAYLKWFSTDNHQSRPNGRGLNDIPKITFKSGVVSSAEGSTMLNYGETIIITSIKSEVAEPDVNEPENGFLVLNFHFAAGARNDVKPGPPSEEAQAITEKLAKIIKTHVINLKNLCIIPKILSRVLYIDAVCLCDSGYAFEAALLAIMISLKQASLPVPILDEESGIVNFEHEGEVQSIDIASWPCSFTFAAINKDILVVEPDFQEKGACGKSKLNIIIDLMSNSAIEITKGPLPVDDETVFTKIKPILLSSSDTVRSLLDL